MPFPDTNHSNTRLIINQIGQATLRLKLGESPEDAMGELRDLLQTLGEQQIPHIIELCWSAHNLVCAVQENTVEVSNDVVESLRLASSYISYVFNGMERGMDPKTDVLDELLERMDLLSSGSSISHVNLNLTEDQILPPREFSALSFPIAQQEDHEPPAEIRHYERLFSDLDLLHHILEVSESELLHVESNFESFTHNLMYARQLVTNMFKPHTIQLEVLARSVETALEDQYPQLISRVSVPHESPTFPLSHSLYSSTYRRLSRALENLIHGLSPKGSTSDEHCIVDYEANGNELQIQLKIPEFPFNHDELTQTLTKCDGLVSNSSQLKLDRIVEFLIDPRCSACSAFSSALTQFHTSLRALGGTVEMHHGNNQLLTVIAKVPQHSRQTLLIPVVSNGNLLAIESDAVEAIVPACVVSYDRVDNAVLYRNRLYKYVQYARSTRPLAPHARDWGLLVLVNTLERSFALRVEVVHDLVECAVKPSHAGFWRGHTAIMTDDIAVLLDTDYLDVSPAATKEQEWNFHSKRFLILNSLFEDFSQLEDSLASRGCTTTITSDLVDMLQQIQELKPDFVITRFHTDGRHDEFARRIIESTSLSRSQVLLLDVELVDAAPIYFFVERSDEADTHQTELLQRSTFEEQLAKLINNPQ